MKKQQKMYRRRMKKAVNRPGFLPLLAVCGLALWCAACGMEDYIYLYPVPDGNINVRLTEYASIRLPAIDPGESQYFTHFNIYYRIYVSDIRISSVINTADQMRTINTTLYSDYNSIYPSTSSNSSSTTVNTSVGSLFSGRRYYELELEGENIETVLSSSAQGTLVIEFPNTINTRPFLTIGGNNYTLWRSTGNNTFTPQPENELYFVNTTELNRTENATTTLNGDVVDKANISGKRYAFVSLYIAKIGRDINTLATIYSAPTFIGIFKLPDDS
jgi:hypothetical protein